MAKRQGILEQHSSGPTSLPSHPCSTPATLCQNALLASGEMPSCLFPTPPKGHRCGPVQVSPEAELVHPIPCGVWASAQRSKAPLKGQACLLVHSLPGGPNTSHPQLTAIQGAVGVGVCLPPFLLPSPALDSPTPLPQQAVSPLRAGVPLEPAQGWPEEHLGDCSNGCIRAGLGAPSHPGLHGVLEARRWELWPELAPLLHLAPLAPQLSGSEYLKEHPLLRGVMCRPRKSQGPSAVTQKT